MKKLIAVFVFSIMILSTVLPICAYAESLSGDGTPESPYMIKTAEDYDYFAYNYDSFEDAYFTLECDLTVTAEPIGSEDTPFIGNFDGKGNTLTFEDEFAGMFGYVDGATISNLTIKGELSLNTGDDEDEYKDYAGAFVAYSVNDSKITNCTFYGSITNQKTGPNYTAAICGYAEDGITIKSCTNYAEIKCEGSYVAGILGYANGETISVEDCTNYGKISGFNYVSGIIGIAKETGFTVDHCINVGEITSARNAGGIMSFENKNCTEEICVLNCANRGNVSINDENSYSAGIVSYGSSAKTDFTIANCSNTGKISGYYRNGGIMAYWCSQVKQKIAMYNCFNGGEISGEYTGAILGYYNLTSTDVIHDNYFDSSKCSAADYYGKLTEKNATALSGNDVNSKVVSALNDFINKDKIANKNLFYWALSNVNSKGEIVTEAGSDTKTQVVFENDIPTADQNALVEGSVLSEGNLWIIIIVAVAAIALVAALIVFKRKSAKTSD